jgi:phosphoribosylaminoimidazole-succinocarboxamide synthase
VFEMGSVKDVKDLGNGMLGFTFSDRYSVFDWGEMPNTIPNKGAALCMQSAYFFDLFRKGGLQNHYIGIGRETPTNVMVVQKVNVIRPGKEVVDGMAKYDYSGYAPDMKGILIPLECIYRNGLPEGSSMLDKLRSGKVNPESLGFENGYVPKAGDRLPKTIYNVTTKLEDGDRSLDWNEAQKIAQLSGTEVEELRYTMDIANKWITKVYNGIGLVNEDGKFEFGRDTAGRLMFVDVLGTLDECRFTYDGVQVSKEIIRQWYKKNQPEWVEEAERIKKSGIDNWREHVANKPKQLPKEFLDIISAAYMATTNALYQGAIIFNGAPPLKEVVADYKKYAEALK